MRKTFLWDGISPDWIGALVARERVVGRIAPLQHQLQVVEVESWGWRSSRQAITAKPT